MYDLDGRDELVRPGCSPRKGARGPPRRPLLLYIGYSTCHFISTHSIGWTIMTMALGEILHLSTAHRFISRRWDNLGCLPRQHPSRPLTPSPRHGSAALEDRRTRPGLPWCFSAKPRTGTEPHRQMPRILVPLTSHLAPLQDLAARCRKSCWGHARCVPCLVANRGRGGGGSIRVKQGFPVDRARELINLILLLSAMPDVLRMCSV